MSNNSNNKNTDKPRARAYFIVKVEPGANAVEVANKIYGNLGGENSKDYEDRFVVTRTDVVSGCTLGEIIVPVDAVILDPDDPEAVLRDVEGRIEGYGGTAAIFKAVVTAHHLYPPHDAYGYVTKEEMIAGQEDGIEEITHAGLQSPRSPGPNAWG